MTELTIEQEFKIRQLQDLLPKADKEDIITVFIALQRQCFTLGNNMQNLLMHWPNHPRITQSGKSNLGISSETKD